MDCEKEVEQLTRDFRNELLVISFIPGKKEERIHNSLLFFVFYSLFPKLITIDSNCYKVYSILISSFGSIIPCV